MKIKYFFSKIKMTLILLLGLFSTLIYSPIQAQIRCLALPDEAHEHNAVDHSSSNRSNTCSDPISFADYATTPSFIVYLNFHLYPDEGEEISDPDLAIEMVYDMVNKAHDVLGNLDTVIVPGPDGVTFPAHVPDTKYRYEIYHESSNPNDEHDGIWLHPQETCFADAYNQRVVDVHIGGTEGCSIGGSGTGGDVYLHGSLEDCFISAFASGNSNAMYARAKLLNHEIGHSLSLDHVAWCENQCNTVDINPIEECQTNFPDVQLCDDYNPKFLNLDGNGTNDPHERLCLWGYGNNMMQQGTALNAITPCQWETVFNYVANSCSPKYSWCPDCQLPTYSTTINDGDNIFWEDDITVTEVITINNGGILNIGSNVICKSNIIVKTGGELNLNGKLTMGNNRRIIVERGAKFEIDGGTITSDLEVCGTWKGIFVHGNANKVQPDYPFDNLEPDDAGVVVLKNGARIEHASTAITTSAPGYSWPGQQARWGGVIHATDSYFINNKRGIQFMKYNQFFNKSVFDYCRFEEEGDYKDGTIGVTIWECKGITFTRNKFLNLDESGIFGIDFGAEIYDANEFKFMNRGIETISTYPNGYNMEIGKESTTRNEFYRNNIHILSESTAQGHKLTVTNNNFYEASSLGIFISGDSRFEVITNSFNDMSNGIQANNTGDAFNFINCNIFNNVTWGIRFEGNNQGSRFLGNSFEEAWSIDISIASLGSATGQVHPFQGSAGNPAHNCFFNGNLRDISTGSSNMPFKYFHDFNKNYCPGENLFHNVPEGNLSDGGFNNYTLKATNPSDVNNCTTSLNPEEEPHDDDDEFDGFNQNVTLKFNVWQADPLNEEKEIAYFEAYEAKTKALEWMLAQALRNGDYIKAENYLQGETSLKSKKWKYGLKILQKEYTAAQNLLNAIPVTTPDEQWYQTVQQINLDRMVSVTEYILPAEKEEFLYTVANSTSTVGSDARSLLALLTDARFDPDISRGNIAEHRSEEVTEVEPDRFILAPNPAKDKVELTYTVADTKDNSRIQLFNMSGNLVFEDVLDQSGSHEINTSSLPPGIYFLTITVEGKALYMQKLAIIR